MRTASISIIVARYPGKAVDGTKVRRGAPIAWCRSTKRVLTADPARFDSLVQSGDSSGPDRFDMMYEDMCAARCGL